MLGLNDAPQIGNLRRIFSHLVRHARGVGHPGDDLGPRQSFDLKLLEAALVHLNFPV